MSHTMNAAQLDRVWHLWHKQHPAGKHCPSCGAKNGIALGDHLFLMPAFDIGAQEVITGLALPVALFACGHCGWIQPVNARVAGIASGGQAPAD